MRKTELHPKHTRLIFLSLFMILIISCQRQSTSTTGIFNKENLPTVLFTIDNSKDTTIVTASGMRLFILKNSFQNEKNAIVKLSNVQRSICLRRYCFGGLSNEGGKPLESSGMFFLEATNEAEQILTLKTTTAIKITLPEIGLKRSFDNF